MQSSWSLYQSMSWLRRSPAFFVRCTEMVPSPCCLAELSVIGSRKRKVIGATGEKRTLVIRRLRCQGCRSIHHELPDFLVPYKHYESSCVEQAANEITTLIVAADESTLYRWRSFVQERTTYWLGCLASLATRFHQDPVEQSSVALQTAHQKIGHVVGNAPGWLARIVRPIANANCWLHTRFAFLSASL
ncbi:DUF6431 domain-containing protein [Cohnella sp.]|uniref:DUF6431 domain-containing protein n=1 Tax=Cohnella sp. TaxID=1883426 RepID=UPI003563B990